MTDSNTPPDRSIAALIADVADRSEAIVATIMDRIRAEIPAYSQLAAAELRGAPLTTLRMLLQAIDNHRQPSKSELHEFFTHGQQRGRQGLALPDMFQAWRIATRIARDELIATGRQFGLDDTVLLELTSELLSVTDIAIDAIARGHHAAEQALVRHDQQRRADLVHGILFATLPAGRARLHIEQYGLDPDRTYHAIRARPTAEAPIDELQRRLDRTGRNARGLLALVDGDLAGFLDQAPTAKVAAAIGVGPATRVEDLHTSFRSATRAMLTADAFGLHGSHDLPSLSILPAVLTDVEVGQTVIARYITPLGGGESRNVLVDTAFHFLTTRMRVDFTAQAMNVHKNTIRYRLRRIEELLRIDLTHPDHILGMWWALQRLRLDTEKSP